MRRRKLGIETRFLVPLREDKNLGTGSLHPVNRWQWLDRLLRERFGAFTVVTLSVKGVYRDPDTGEAVVDESREYRIAVERREVAKLRRLLGGDVTRVFVQKCIYFVVGADAELVYNESL